VTKAGLPAFLAAFAFRNYRLLWTGAFLSSLGTWTQDVALAWLIHTRFENSLYLGLRAFAAEAPLLAFMLIGGAFADRVDRRRILLTSQLLQMCFAVALVALYVLDRLGIGAILLLAFLTGLAQSQSSPTYQAVITSLVPPRQIPNAVALNSLQFNLSRAIGPVIAGLLLARVGTGACFTANALSFVAVILALWRLEMPPPAPASSESLRDSLRAGVRHVTRSPLLSLLTLLAAGVSFLGFPLITYLPVIASELLGGGAGVYSMLLFSFGLGAIAGAIATAHRGHAPGRGRTLLVSLSAFGACALGAVFSTWLWVSMPLLLVAGFTVVSGFSTLNSLVQEQATDALRGRIMSIYGLAFRGGNPIGSLVAGALIGPLGISAVLGGFGGLLVLLCAGIYWRSARLRAL
jgi:predicted MFS family arabinose efflux permease